MSTDNAPAKAQHTAGHTDIVFDGPPDHPSPAFVEVEDEHGRSIRFGEWLKRGDGSWVLRIVVSAQLIAAAPAMREELERLDIALTNMMQVYEYDSLKDSARDFVRRQRDKTRALLARIDGGV